MIWDWIDEVEIFGVDVWVVFELFADRIIFDVGNLIFEIVPVSDAVFVVAAVPDLS